MEGITLEKLVLAKKRCPECVGFLEILDEDLRNINSKINKNQKETNYSKLIRVVGIGLGLGVNGYFISNYLSQRYMPDFIDFVYSNFNN